MVKAFAGSEVIQKMKARRGLAGDRAAPQETPTCLSSLSQALVVTRSESTADARTPQACIIHRLHTAHRRIKRIEIRQWHLGRQIASRGKHVSRVSCCGL